MPCPSGYNICHAMPVRPYHIPCHAHQAIEYTILFPPGYTTYHAKPARPEHITCHARQAIPCTMPCTPGHTINHAITRQVIPYANQAIPYTMPCPPVHTISPSGHNIYRVMPTRPYHISCHVYPGNTVYHAMPSQAIPNTMPCPPGHTINNAIPARPYHIPCHACYGKGPKCLVTMSLLVNYVYM